MSYSDRLLQMEAFEAGGHKWWLVTTQEEMLASCVRAEETWGKEERDGGENLAITAAQSQPAPNPEQPEEGTP